MENSEILIHAKNLLGRCGMSNDAGAIAAFVEARQFIRAVAGPRSEFFQTLNRYEGQSSTWLRIYAQGALTALINHVENGLFEAEDFRSQIRADVVSGYLEMAAEILQGKDQHPAAAAMIIGASLEQFLRQWVEEEPEVQDAVKKPSIGAFAQALRKHGHISKQDLKDITSWAGYRNDAAHGRFDDVDDRKRILNMLEGVNHFMRFARSS